MCVCVLLLCLRLCLYYETEPSVVPKESMTLFCFQIT